MNVNRYREEAPWTGSASNVACIEISLWSWPIGPDLSVIFIKVGTCRCVNKGGTAKRPYKSRPFFRDGAFFIFQPFLTYVLKMKGK